MADKIRSAFEIPIVEREGVAEEVWELATDLNNPKSAKAICEILARKGIEISLDAMKRWLAKKRKEMAGEARDIISNHIHKHLPSDLNTLEEIEKTALNKTKAKIVYKSHEMATEQKFIEHFLDNWGPALKACKDAKGLRKVAKEVLAQCFKWTFEAINWDQNLRNEAKVVLTAIDMKLKYQTQLHGAGSGNINIIQGPRKTGGEPEDPGTSLPETQTIEIKGEEEGLGKLRVLKRGEK